MPPTPTLDETRQALWEILTDPAALSEVTRRRLGREPNNADNARTREIWYGFLAFEFPPA